MLAARLLAVVLTIVAAGCNLYFGASSGDHGSDAGVGSDAGGRVDAPPPDAGGGGSTAIELDLNLGHATPITVLHRTATRVVSGDASFHWVLWDVATRTPVASGTPRCAAQGKCPADFATLSDGALLIRDIDASPVRPHAVEVRSPKTGALRFTIIDATSAGQASDDSYTWAASQANMRAFAPDGTRLFLLPGDYSRAQVSAAPEEIRMLDGTDPRALQRINVAGQSMIFVPIQGKFAAWFTDGTAFLTTLGFTAWVYASDGTLRTIGTLPGSGGLGGVGGYVWQWDTSQLGAPLRIYAASDLGAPIQTVLGANGKFVPVGHTIAFLRAGADVLQLISLGASVTIGPEIAAGPRYLSAFDIDPDGHWIVGNIDGVVTDDAAARASSGDTYSLGRALSIAGSRDGLAAIATASGHVVVLPIGDSTALRHIWRVPASQIALSDDGSVLVAAVNQGSSTLSDDSSLRTLSTADGSVIQSWSYPNPSPGLTGLVGFTFAPRGRVLVQLLDSCGADGCTNLRRLYTDVTGKPLPSYGPVLESRLTYVEADLPRLSPDGSNAIFGPTQATTQPATQVYANGSLVTAVPAVALAWMLDSNHFLGATYHLERQVAVQDGAHFYDLRGQVTGTALLPDVHGNSLIPVGGTLLYWPQQNSVIDYATGAVTWKGAAGITTAVPVGDHVLYTSNERVLIDRFRH